MPSSRWCLRSSDIVAGEAWGLSASLKGSSRRPCLGRPLVASGRRRHCAANGHRSNGEAWSMQSITANSSRSTSLALGAAQRPYPWIHLKIKACWMLFHIFATWLEKHLGAVKCSDCGRISSRKYRVSPPTEVNAAFFLVSSFAEEWAFIITIGFLALRVRNRKYSVLLRLAGDLSGKQIFSPTRYEC